jgi:hypothetical protein
MERRQFVLGLMAASMAARAALGQSAAQQMAPAINSAAPPAAPPIPTANPAPGPMPWMRGLLEVKPLPIGSVVPDAVASPATRYFSRQQMATLRQLCEIMMPPLKGYPGAMDAGAPEFIDFLISVSPADQQQVYKAGLDRLDADAKKKFGVAFSEVNAQQADALIRPWMRAWMSDHLPTESMEHFINLAHMDIRTATMNSRAWNDAAVAAGERPQGVGLYWYPVEADVEQKYLPRS